MHIQVAPRSHRPAVCRRQIFFVAGYDPVLPQQYYRRFARQLEIFKRTWKVEATPSKPHEDEGCLSWSVATSGPDWRVSTDFELWAWDDIVHKASARPSPLRIWDAAGVYLEFLFNGTVARYVKANPRYFLFAVVPPLEIFAFAAVAVLTGLYMAKFFELAGIVRPVTIGAIGVAGFLLLLRWPGRRFRVEQALDDWIFCWEYVHGRRPDVEARLEIFAERLVACVQKHSADEIVIVGHSFGATFAMDVVARALARDQDLGRRGPPIGILTVGATIPKCTLHPAAHRIRAAVAKVAAETPIYWAEYQARSDAINFYKFHPVTLRRIERDLHSHRPTIRLVQFHDMLRPETYALITMRILRLHYQLVSANERHWTYDYYMMACGPIPFAAWTVAPIGILDFMNTDGSRKVCAAAAAP